MVIIERTAYPRFPKVLAAKDLQASYTPLPEELEWARRSTRGERPRLGLLVLLNRMRVRARDDLADMFIRRMGEIHKRARVELELLQSRQREQMENLVVLLDGVVDILIDDHEGMNIAG